jgi:hypothetical protein
MVAGERVEWCVGSTMTRKGDPPCPFFGSWSFSVGAWLSRRWAVQPCDDVTGQDLVQAVVLALESGK